MNSNLVDVEGQIAELKNKTSPQTGDNISIGGVWPTVPWQGQFYASVPYPFAENLSSITVVAVTTYAGNTIIDTTIQSIYLRAGRIELITTTPGVGGAWFYADVTLT